MSNKIIISINIVGKRDVTKNAGTPDEKKASVIYYTCHDKSVIGQGVGSSWVSGNVIPYENICVGCNYNITFSRGFVNRMWEKQVPEGITPVAEESDMNGENELDISRLFGNLEIELEDAKAVATGALMPDDTLDGKCPPFTYDDVDFNFSIVEKTLSEIKKILEPGK